jgi:prepilin-type N-terminal cleavage/methylation domain-containing protein
MMKRAQGGFTLMEVMIAVTLFTTFAAAFLVSQGYNLSDSALSEEQLKLHMLCQQRMNEVLINPPKFTNALENLKETKPFEEDGFEAYSWTIEWKRLKVPDFAKIFAAQGQAGAGGDSADSGDDNKYFDDDTKSGRNSGVETMVFDKLKENIEKVLWQVRLTATNNDTKYSYTLSRWVRNRDEPIQLNLNF